MQSFVDFEVIISDDASTDNSLKIAKKWQDQDKRFKLFSHSENVGMTQNWNQALNYATGKFIMKLDADDAYNPATLEHLVNAISAPDTGIAFCRTLECNDDLTIKNTYRGEQALISAAINPAHDVIKSAQEWYQLTLADAQLWHSNAFIVPRELLISMDGWNDDFGCASDTDLIFRLLEQNHKVAHLSYLGVLYRMREGSISDGFRQNDKLVDENYITSLKSVKRFHNAGKKLTYRAKLNWFRIYLNARNRVTKVENSALSSVVSDCKPPLSVMLLGTVQRYLYQLKMALAK